MYTYIPISLLSCISLQPSLTHPSRWSQSTEMISLWHAASHELSILYLVVYMCKCHSLTLSQLTLPAPCVLKSTLHLHLYACPAPRFFRTIIFFLDSIYMCQHTVLVFLFLTYFTLYDRLQVHPPHYKKLSFVPFYD